MQLRQFERSRFFAGQLLTADDLQREQDYHRDKARLHNRFLHGWESSSAWKTKGSDPFVSYVAAASGTARFLLVFAQFKYPDAESEFHTA